MGLEEKGESNGIYDCSHIPDTEDICKTMVITEDQDEELEKVEGIVQIA
jgi:hypothetical protein